MADLVLSTSRYTDPYIHVHRAAMWNAYFYGFFGSHQDHVRPDLRPLSGDEVCQEFSRVIDKTGGMHPDPRTLTRHLRRLHYSGYRPVGDYKRQFDSLVNRAQQAQTGEDMVALFEDTFGNPPERFPLGGGGPSPVADQLSSRERPRDSQPTVVTFDGYAWAIKKEFLLEHPIKDITHLLNPMNWELLAPIFKQTERIEPRKAPVSMHDPWSGILHEKIEINWNAVAIQSFDTFLDIDFTVAEDVTRADYSLRYEKDNQILLDDGYVEARKESREVTRYIGYKRVRFASSFLNFVAPALICMLLQQDTDGLQDRLDLEADAMGRTRKTGQPDRGGGRRNRPTRPRGMR